MNKRILNDFSVQNICTLMADITPAEPLRFTLGFREDDGSEVVLQEDEFQLLSSTDSELVFSGMERFQTLRFRLTWKTEEDVICVSGDISGVPEDLLLEYVEPMILSIPAAGNTLLLVQNEGVLIDLEKGNPVSGEPGWHYHSFFPGRTEAQFMSVLNKNGCGLYIGAHDPSRATKCFECNPDGIGMYALKVRYYCGNGNPDRIFRIPGKLVFRYVDGGWMDAAEIYRTWMEQNSLLPEKYNFPAFVKDSPVILIHPVRGRGTDRGQMDANEYFPYTNAMPVIDRMADALDSKVMSLLMHWEGTAPWAPPYVWPPYGGEENLAEYRDMLHAKGHTLGVYCSGTAWTQYSTIDMSYSRKKQFEKEHLTKEMIRGPHGEMEAMLCNGWDQQRFGFDMCMVRQWPRNTVKNELAKMADFGFDYIQFFDQNIGGAAHWCWSRNHGHPPVPGVWQVDNMRQFLDELSHDYPQLVLGCEAAAAEPYLNVLKFNDLRFNWNIRYAKAVPLYAFLFHEYVNNFMGNQCNLKFYMDFADAPYNLLWRIAYSFHAGDLLSIVLRDGGRPAWSWVYSWDEAVQPEEGPVLELVRNLNAIRKQYPEFFSRGRMIKPLVKVRGGKWTLPTKRGNFEYDSFFTTSWRSPEGKNAQFVINFLPYKQEVKVEKNGNTEIVELPPLNAVIVA